MGGAPWWRRAVIYQIYPRSFADASGDGEGDIAGMRDRLPYLEDLGVDGIWISPWYPSPMADGGYDVSDFTGIHPLFGSSKTPTRSSPRPTLPAFGSWSTSCRTTPPNSIRGSQAALAAPPGSAERGRYFFRDGTGPDGDEPPNNWISCFGGIGWERVARPTERPGSGTCTCSRDEQPDLDWTNRCVLDDFDDVLRFWFDRGVDGIRVDAAPAIGKADGLPDADYGGDLRFMTMDWVGNPHWDVDEVHEVFRRWRALADSYGGDRIFVAEAVVSSAERLSNYLRPDEMHSAFNFPYMKGSWDATRCAG